VYTGLSGRTDHGNPASSDTLPSVIHFVPFRRNLHSSTVVLFVTGEGQTSPPGVTGKVTAMLTTPQPRLPVSVLIGGQSASVASYGEAPGVMRLAVKIPSDAPPGNVPISVSVGGNKSQSGVTVSVE